MANRGGDILSPLERADREDEIAGWLVRHGAEPDHAGPLAETSVTISMLEIVAKVASGEALAAALRWLAVACRMRLLAGDVENAAGRIHELVAAVKRFTYMDSRSGPELVCVEEGLRDTVKVIASKANAKSASMKLEIEPDLPRVCAAGPELNQVWLNLLDNALDAALEGGGVIVRAAKVGDNVIVRIVDDGPGIPPEALPRIFDPFFTTKPPGQGTGLGLDIARRIVRAYRGEIVAESRPGRTEFRVSLVAESPR
jgi:signal transduction histidine kinase